MKLIDVSEWQGEIDYEKLKGSIDGIIIRAGYGKGNIDKQFERNAKMCNLYGIPCGAYWFSYAKSKDEAKLEAAHLISAVKPYKMELPLAFDYEYDSLNNARNQGVNVTKKLVSEMIRDFCNAIESAGYWALNYTNPDFITNWIDESITKRYGLWLAQYPISVDVKNPPMRCAIWQWGVSSIPGIDGKVDTNEAYTDFVTIIRENGLNNLKHTQTKPQDEKADAVSWATENGISGSEETILSLWQYHKKFGK